MDVLTGMRTFRVVASTGSFAAAARSLSITKAWASKLVSQLEEHLGAQLLVRTTRRLSLTDVGRLYLERCAQILDDLEEAEQAVGDLQAAPRGRLRVSIPMSFGLARVAPLLAEFCQRCPELELDVSYNDRVVDLVDEAFDVAIRIGASLQDSTLIVRKIASGERLACASPGYLRSRGTPRHPLELAQHQCLRYSLHSAPSKWLFERSGERVTVEVRGPMQANNSIALRSAAVAGVGVLLAPDFVVADDLRAKKLRRLLPEWRPTRYGVFVVSPPARFATPKVRAFVEFLGQSLAGNDSTARG